MRKAAETKTDQRTEAPRRTPPHKLRPTGKPALRAAAKSSSGAEWIVYPGERVADLLRENAKLRRALVELEGQASTIEGRPGLEGACELARKVMK